MQAWLTTREVQNKNPKKDDFFSSPEPKEGGIELPRTTK